MIREGSNSAKSAPLVSVITPFYNTEQYIAECIESVLGQTYSNWEYLLVVNKSTDAWRDIAERYARNDKRVRLFDTPKFLSQTDNFEAALRYMSPDSQYCKMVFADDWLFPECLERMVAFAEANSTVGIVSSYRLYGNEITGDGLPHSSKLVPGRQACRSMLREGYYLTGSPTSIPIRADIDRKKQPFYPLGIHEDTEACFQILAEHDLGFIHQVLTFSRKDNESLTSDVVDFHPGPRESSCLPESMSLCFSRKLSAANIFGGRPISRESSWPKAFSSLNRATSGTFIVGACVRWGLIFGDLDSPSIFLWKCSILRSTPKRLSDDCFV